MKNKLFTNIWLWHKTALLLILKLTPTWPIKCSCKATVASLTALVLWIEPRTTTVHGDIAWLRYCGLSMTPTSYICCILKTKVECAASVSPPAGMVGKSNMNTRGCRDCNEQKHNEWLSGSAGRRTRCLIEWLVFYSTSTQERNKDTLPRQLVTVPNRTWTEEWDIATFTERLTRIASITKTERLKHTR